MSLFSFFQAFSFVVIFLKQNIFVSGFEQLSSFSTNVQKQSKQCNLFLGEERPKPTKKGIAKNQNSSHQQAGTFFRLYFFWFEWSNFCKERDHLARLFSLRCFNFKLETKKKANMDLLLILWT